MDLNCFWIKNCLDLILYDKNNNNNNNKHNHNFNVFDTIEINLVMFLAIETKQNILNNKTTNDRVFTQTPFDHVFTYTPTHP